MTRRRLAAVVGLAAVPLLVVCLVALAGSGAALLWGTAAWALGVVVLEAVLWRSIGSPHRDLLTVLGAESTEVAGVRVRELTREAALDRAEQERMSALVEDLSSGLGEGLVVVDPDLRIRLINRNLDADALVMPG